MSDQYQGPPASQSELAKSREGMSERSQSLWAIYVKRFKRHRLGKLGLFLLLLLYVSSLFAGFLSPYTMRWTNKEKSYHPPTGINWLYERPDGSTVLKPWVYEKKLVNVALKEYGIVPPETLRAVSIPPRVQVAGLHAVSIQADPAEREAEIVEAVQGHYNLAEDSPALDRLRDAIAEIEAAENPDERRRFRVGTETVRGEEQPQELWLAKGNKNFLSFFARGVPYRFLDLFEVQRRLVTSKTGGLYLLGTDHLGRDIVSRLLHGSRISLTVGLLGAFISFAVGLIYGGISGYFGGAVDNVMMRVAEAIIAVPTLYLLFTLRAAFPPDMSSIQVYVAIVAILSLFGFATVSRVIRGMVLSIKTEDFVLSARTMGLSNWKVIHRHILPNTVSYVIVQTTIMIPGFILGESALSLLGLGITEPQSSWGLMLAVARNTRVVQDFPWILVPGFAIFVAVLAWNFFGDGIRDSVDPKSKV
jgi:peptide/nickel transport system permease protein